MNNKGQFAQLGLTIVIAVMIFMSGMIFINVIKDSVVDARTALSCSSALIISDGTKLTCLGIDIILPYFILTIFSLAGGLIISKFAI